MEFFKLEKKTVDNVTAVNVKINTVETIGQGRQEDLISSNITYTAFNQSTNYIQEPIHFIALLSTVLF